jgi:hypothetical protein
VSLIYIACTGGIGITFTFIAYFFEYKFEGVGPHHYEKSLSFSMDNRSASYITKSFTGGNKERPKSLNSSTHEDNVHGVDIEEMTIPLNSSDMKTGETNNVGNNY